MERSFAHALETGGMRRTHLRHHENIAKRILVHVAGFNLGLLMRKRFGVGKPRCLQGRGGGRLAALIAALVALTDRIWRWNELQVVGCDTQQLTRFVPVWLPPTLAAA